MRQRAPRPSSTRYRPRRPVPSCALAACGSDRRWRRRQHRRRSARRSRRSPNRATTRTEEENLAALQSLADAAPSEISDEMNELVDGFEQLQSFDPEAASDEEMTEFLAIAGSLDEASTAIEEFALENCPDLPADLFATE